VTTDDDDLADARAREIFRHLPFPFPGDVFPANLGAVVVGSVLSGERPAREVIHTPDGSWAVGDGVSDPNEAGASGIGHMSHVVEWNSSVAQLATMPPNHIAKRSGPDEAWVIFGLEGWEDDSA
jgi:hypothetical protein